MLLYKPVENGEEAEFTLIYPLNDEYIGTQCAMSFIYISGLSADDKHEEEELVYKVNEDGTFTINSQLSELS